MKYKYLPYLDDQALESEHEDDEEELEEDQIYTSEVMIWNLMAMSQVHYIYFFQNGEMAPVQCRQQQVDLMNTRTKQQHESNANVQRAQPFIPPRQTNGDNADDDDFVPEVAPRKRPLANEGEKRKQCGVPTKRSKSTAKKPAKGKGNSKTASKENEQPNDGLLSSDSLLLPSQNFYQTQRILEKTKERKIAFAKKSKSTTSVQWPSEQSVTVSMTVLLYSRVSNYINFISAKTSQPSRRQA